MCIYIYVYIYIYIERERGRERCVYIYIYIYIYTILIIVSSSVIIAIQPASKTARQPGNLLGAATQAGDRPKQRKRSRMIHEPSAICLSRYMFIVCCVLFVLCVVLLV